MSTSLVYDVAVVSPLQRATVLSSQAKANVYLKREDLQPVHSFKLRGAHNKIAQLSPADLKRGVIAASAGNHAQGVALSAQKLGISALIVMPQTTPAIKIEAVRGYGADVVLYGDSYSDAYEHSQTLVASTGRVFIHPFDDPLVIEGQGTIGTEILEQLPGMTHIFIPVGGGGLIAGVAQAIKKVRPEVEIIGVEPIDSAAMHDSLKTGERVQLEHVGIFADGVAVKQVGGLTFELAQQYVDQIILVDNDQICAAIKATFEETRSIVEPAGALALAGLQSYKLLADAQAVAICSGANMSFERLQFIAERTLLGSAKEALFAVRLDERPAALSRFCNEVVNGHSITEFNYRLTDRQQATIFVGISQRDAADKQRFETKLKKLGYEYSDLSYDELAKEHIRHMIGGPSQQTEHEKLYDITFPERPGALSQFLAALGDQWNISLFHYRGQGGDEGKVLLGLEAADQQAVKVALDLAGYEYAAVRSRAAELFL